MACPPAMLALCASLTGSPSVVDGDTLRFATRSVRLYGIDAPERFTPQGFAATAALKRLVATRQPVQCIPTGAVSHGRVVATCYTARGHDLGAILVQHGHALDCWRYSGGRYRAFEPHGVRLRLTQSAYCAPRTTR